MTNDDRQELIDRIQYLEADRNGLRIHRNQVQAERDKFREVLETIRRESSSTWIAVLIDRAMEKKP